ncbi:hypothetical protein ACM42_26425 [Bradyrhizobium sp. CCBAU 25338]|nr:hypothetical protein [Bradyrhizobium sp. CCBAU 45389]MDA9531931.1 hypothetical protein [Bradyrhizobium sp. CCBAU 25338]RXH32279.1 hypothetical protein XH84_13785 [Bradyrhizobium nanningense]
MQRIPNRRQSVAFELDQSIGNIEGVQQIVPNLLNKLSGVASEQDCSKMLPIATGRFAHRS